MHMADLYERLRDKIDRVAKGFPATENGVEIELLKQFFSPDDAEFYLSMEEERYVTPGDVARSTGEDPAVVAEKMEDMARRNLLFRLRGPGEVKYRILPVLHGFYEFNINMMNPKITRNFSKLFKDGGLGRSLYAQRIPIFRTIPVHSGVVSGQKVLPLDDAVAILKSKKLICVTDCFCRTAAQLGGRGCDHPLDTCLVFDYFAEFYIENAIGNTRVISVDEAMEILNRSDSAGLVRLIANSQNPEVMCSCCSCCCGQMVTLRLFGGTSREVMSNYTCRKDEALCVNDGVCVNRCPVGAHKMLDGKAQFNQDLCIGCGLCVTSCPTGAVTLLRKPDEKEYYPDSSTLFDTYDDIGRERKR